MVTRAHAAPRAAATWTAGLTGARLSRRTFLQAVGAVGLAGTAACTDGNGGLTPTGAGAEPTAGAAAASDDTVPGPPWKGGTRGGTGIHLWGDESLTMDPPLAYGFGDYYNLSNFFRGLAFYDETNTPQLDLAEAMDVSDDGLTYAFTLKPDITFHNGRPVTAADFKWTFERSSSKDIASWVQAFLGSVNGHAEFVAGTAKDISGIVAQDDRTLVLKLRRPDVTILNVVAIPPFYVLAKEEVEKAGDKVSSTPVGAGPYKLADWDDNGRTFTAQRFENYVYAGHVPYLDTLEHQWGVSEDVRYLKVSRDEADLTLDVPASAIPRIKKNPEQSERFKEWSSFSINWWEFDVTKAPFDDVRVRQAFNYAFDRDRAVPLGFQPTGTFLPPDLLGADESAPAYTYDPDKAKELLAEAGADGLEITLPVLDSGLASTGRLAQLLQQDLKAVGVTATLEQIADTPYDIGAELPNRYRLWNMGWGMGLPDPSELTSSLIGTGAPSNYGGYSNPKIDVLAAQALGEGDRDARAALYAEIESLLLADAPFLFFGVNVRNTFASTPLQNVMWTPVLWTYWDRFWKDA